MGKKSSKSSDPPPPPPPPQKPKKSHKKSENSNLEHSESNMDLKTGDLKHSPTLISSPAAPKSPKPLTANPKSSKLATPAKKAGIVDEDAILILENVVQFMSGNGGKTPTETSIKPLFESINNFLTRKVSTGSQLYYRIRSLKNKYFRLIENKVDIDSPELSTFIDLGAKIWGHANGYDVKGDIVNGNGSKGKRKKLEEDEISEEKTKKLEVEENDDNNHDKDDDENGFEIDDAKNSDMFPIMYEQAKGLWVEKGYSMDDLERGFESIDKSKCKKLEKNWKELIVKDKELEIKKLKTDIEIRTMVSKMI